MTVLKILMFQFLKVTPVDYKNTT